MSDHDFNAMALDLFHYQAKNNKVYAEFLTLIDKSPDLVFKREDIPFLPISLYKTHDVRTGTFNEEAIFESSSTTSTGISRHAIRSLSDYLANTVRIFSNQFSDLRDYTVLGLLPNYLERQNSSLVHMVDHFIVMSKSVGPNYFLYDHEALFKRLHESGKVLLFGVSFALLDFAEKYMIEKDDLLIIETGGMKGRKKELTKQEVYTQLRKAFPNAQICSEYGMTELMSQAYSDEQGFYTCPPWMKIITRLDSDPLSGETKIGRGAINIIDLANIDSCAFIATEDLGRTYEDGRFEVLGRLDIADIRGCSLMVS